MLQSPNPRGRTKISFAQREIEAFAPDQDRDRAGPNKKEEGSVCSSKETKVEVEENSSGDVEKNRELEVGDGGNGKQKREETAEVETKEEFKKREVEENKDAETKIGEAEKTGQEKVVKLDNGITCDSESSSHYR